MDHETIEKTASLILCQVENGELRDVLESAKEYIELILEHNQSAAHRGSYHITKYCEEALKEIGEVEFGEVD